MDTSSFGPFWESDQAQPQKALRKRQKHMAKQPRWPPTCKRFVAFLDIMGFKERMLRKRHEHVLETLKLFRKKVSPIEIEAREALSGRKQSTAEDVFGPSIVRPVFFSDSILLVSNDDSFGAAYQIIFNVQWILQQALRTQVPIKGAIACGKQTADFEDSLHFGAPLIDAYELQKQVKLYGVVLHHTMEERLAKLKVLGTDKSLMFPFGEVVKYPVPLKEGGNVNHYVVSWFDEDDAVVCFGDEGSLEPALLKLYGTVSGSARSYVDNTLALARWLDERKKEEDLKASRPALQRTKNPI